MEVLLIKNLNVAIPTPFHDDESLNLESFKPIVEHMLDNGIESLLVSGSTGEQNSMSFDERLEIIDYFNQKKFKDVELIFGVSATRTSDALRLVEALEESVFDAILLQFPLYIQPTQKQAIAYVNDILKNTTKKVVLYNNPSKTGFNLSVDSFNELVTQQHTNLVGMKEEYNVKRHKDTETTDNFLMFAGGDIDLIEKITGGSNALSSMVGNVYPKEIKQILNDLLTSKPVNVQRINKIINEVTHYQTVMNIKNHYNSLGINVGPCRSPIN